MPWAALPDHGELNFDRPIDGFTRHQTAGLPEIFPEDQGRQELPGGHGHAAPAVAGSMDLELHSANYDPSGKAMERYL
jgi:hypothetical protein